MSNKNAQAEAASRWLHACKSMQRALNDVQALNRYTNFFIDEKEVHTTANEATLKVAAAIATLNTWGRAFTDAYGYRPEDWRKQ